MVAEGGVSRVWGHLGSSTGVPFEPCVWQQSKAKEFTSPQCQAPVLILKGVSDA